MSMNDNWKTYDTYRLSERRTLDTSTWFKVKLEGRKGRRGQQYRFQRYVTTPTSEWIDCLGIDGKLHSFSPALITETVKAKAPRDGKPRATRPRSSRSRTGQRRR